MGAAKGFINIQLDDGRGLSLASSDWIGEGGEGAVYKKGDLAIKIVEDRVALAKKEPKLRIFKSIRHPQLATPSSLAYDGAGALVGYAMPMVEGLPLARLMAPSWRAANGYGERWAGAWPRRWGRCTWPAAGAGTSTSSTGAFKRRPRCSSTATRGAALGTP